MKMKEEEFELKKEDMVNLTSKSNLKDTIVSLSQDLGTINER